MAAVTAFKKGYVTSEVIDASDFTSFASRKLRYSIFWSFYSQDAYDDVHSWAKAYRTQYGLYRYIRNLRSPAYRIGEFYKAHLLGGSLDEGAGEAGAIPIETDNERIRGPISEIWRWSNWAQKKDVLTLRGSVLGDVAIEVVDDVAAGRVRLSILHPGLIESVDLDDYGNVKGYVIEYKVWDPSGAPRKVTYREEVSRDGDYCVYTTYKDGEPFAWPGNVNRSGEGVYQWGEAYGFVPLVLIAHNDVGGEWGWSEFQPLASKMREADDIASAISDQIRKSVDPIWLAKGMRPASLHFQGDDTSTDRPQPGREEHKFLFADRDSDVKALVADLDLEQSLAYLESLVRDIESDYPELGLHIETSAGDASGRALRVARQPAVSKVLQRRAGYDAGLVSAQKMALSIGVMRGYYSGIGTFAGGDFEHRIGDRAVFENDELDEIEIEAAFWEAAAAATDAGVELSGFLADQGWPEERIALVTQPATAGENTGERNE